MEGWDLRALAVLERLNAAGHRAVLVGGCVRDRLMGRTPHDYDAATSARPEQIREACAPMRVVETGVRHGTVTVLSGGLPVEVTTFRREGRYTDHRRPDRVEFTGDLGEDLARRDMDDAPIDESNYEELNRRIDAYIAEFDQHGTDNILVDSDTLP